MTAVIDATIDAVTQETEYDRFSTRIRLTSKDHKALVSECERIFAYYPPQGYSTRYEAKPYYFGSVWTAVVSRSNSCD